MLLDGTHSYIDAKYCSSCPPSHFEKLILSVRSPFPAAVVHVFASTDFFCLQTLLFCNINDYATLLSSLFRLYQCFFFYCYYITGVILVAAVNVGVLGTFFLELPYVSLYQQLLVRAFCQRSNLKKFVWVLVATLDCQCLHTLL